ncbi:MAG: xanthine dehydrogenase family protein subunit M [Planctomycetota bacterium]|jgi:xanthine dehydrogenase YagS FAD-binding subunit|nr:xanthine dehydrogenase family protein subunit M [Planctomycetota bacterium]MDP6990248.1 xanthine dehydrogenase family protein subunit M [Planctomycetota bacterium]
MKAFDYVEPSTLAEAVAALAKGGGRERIVALAGGQDLLSEMQDHLVEPGTVVSLNRIDGLAHVRSDAGGLSVGARASLAEVARDEGVRTGWTALAEAAASVGSPQIRSQATVGGNLCQRPRCIYYRNEHALCLKKGGQECFAEGGLNHANAILGGGPSFIVHPSDLAPALVALDATVRITGPEGGRVEVLEGLFTLPSEGEVTRETSLEPGELITSVEVPAPAAGVRSTYLKFQERASFDFALSSVALALGVVEGRINHARICLGGVAPVPWRCERTEQLLVGEAPGEELFARAALDALEEAEPLEHNGYKVPLTQGLLRKALRSLT